MNGPLSPYNKDQCEALRERELQTEVEIRLLATVAVLQSELVLNQAAIVRETAEIAYRWHHKEIYGGSWMSRAALHTAIRDAILAFPTDQPALDRYVKEQIQKKGYHDFLEYLNDFQRMPRQEFCETHGSDIADALDRHDADIAAESQNELVQAGWLDPEAITELKSQFAAVMEKAAVNCKPADPSENDEGCMAGCHDHDQQAIRALIPTDYAAALADRVREAVREELEGIDKVWKGHDGWTNLQRYLAKRLREVRAATEADIPIRPAPASQA